MNPQGDLAYVSAHFQEAQKLEAEGYLELFRIHMTPPTGGAVDLYLSSKNTVTWQGATWEGFAVNLADYRKDSSGEMSRPKFSCANPSGEFTRYAHQGWLDGAEFRRYRVLKPHVDANINSYLLNTWRSGRVVQLSVSIIILELRSVLDGQSFVLPGRAFLPPEFPSVSI